MTHTTSLMKRFALTTAICGGLMAGQHAFAQERGLLSDPAQSGFNAAGAAAQDSGQGQAQQGQLQQGAQVQGQLGGQVQPQPGIQVQPQGTIQGGIQSQPQAIPGQPVIQGQPGQQQFGAQQPGARLQAGQGQDGVQLGIQVEPHEEGLKVVNVREDSVAKKAGLKEGDIIKRFNDKEVNDAQTLHTHVNQAQPGDEVELVVMREDEEEKLTAKFEQNQDRYAAARPALDDSIHAEIESLRNEIKQLREEMKAMKEARGDDSQAEATEADDNGAEENDNNDE